MAESEAKFGVGQLVCHRLFGYRGVIADADPTFQLSEEWYEEVARSRPPRDQPWYHVLVHEGSHTTYVAERNLAADESGEPVRHPQLSLYFSDFSDGRYRPASPVN
jgi:heat shock protein HspQ